MVFPCFWPSANDRFNKKVPSDCRKRWVINELSWKTDYDPSRLCVRTSSSFLRVLFVEPTTLTTNTTLSRLTPLVKFPFLLLRTRPWKCHQIQLRAWCSNCCSNPQHWIVPYYFSEGVERCRTQPESSVKMWLMRTCLTFLTLKKKTWFYKTIKWRSTGFYEPEPLRKPDVYTFLFSWASSFIFGAKVPTMATSPGFHVCWISRKHWLEQQDTAYTEALAKPGKKDIT